MTLRVLDEANAVADVEVKDGHPGGMLPELGSFGGLTQV
jgi:hypothetical protein